MPPGRYSRRPAGQVQQAADRSVGDLAVAGVGEHRVQLDEAAVAEAGAGVGTGGQGGGLDRPGTLGQDRQRIQARSLGLLLLPHLDVLAAHGFLLRHQLAHHRLELGDPLLEFAFLVGLGESATGRRHGDGNGDCQGKAPGPGARSCSHPAPSLGVDAMSDGVTGARRCEHSPLVDRP